MATNKKTDINEDAYVKMLVDAGVSESEAKVSIGKLVSFVNEQMAGEGAEGKNAAISIKVRERVKELKSDHFTVIVVAAEPRVDSNEISRNIALATYNNDRELALSKGIVKVVKEGTVGAKKAKDNSWILAIDNRDFIDKNNTMKNRGKGKPYPVRMQRNTLIVSNGQLGMAYGDVNLDIGGEYEVFGKVKEGKNSVTIYSDPAPKLNRMVPENELYDVFFKAARDSDIATDVAGALETDNKGIIVVKGTAHIVNSTSNGGARIVLNTDIGNGLPLMSPYGDEGAPYVEQMLAVPVGAEVLAVGKKRDSDQYGRSLTTYGVIANPKASAVTKTLESLKGFDF